MDTGFSQLIWVILFVIFLVVTVLKNRARMKSGQAEDKPRGEKLRTRGGRDRLSNFLEEIFIREELERKPLVHERKQQIKALEKKTSAKPERVGPKPEARKKIGESTYPLSEHAIGEKKPLHLKKKDPLQKKRPWETNSKDDLQGAIVFAEILGPPIAKRKNHRLF
ncbi:MAG: hypothetical protein MRK01_15390 [Candidatus Scalindua sp.]|nr:hypothetical protein [Candidatus Scalindua sp.]